MLDMCPENTDKTQPLISVQPNFSCLLLWVMEKRVYEELFIKVELLECRPGSLEVSLSLNSADLAGQGYGLI